MSTEISLTVNGEPRRVPAGSSIADLVRLLETRIERLASQASRLVADGAVRAVATGRRRGERPGS